MRIFPFLRVIFLISPSSVSSYGLNTTPSEVIFAVVSTLAAPAFIDTEFLNVHRISVTADAAFTLLNLIGMTESKSIIISIKAVF